MSTTRGPVVQSLAEINYYEFDYAPRLPPGAKINSARADYTAPNAAKVALGGSAIDITGDPIVVVKLGKLLVKGIHFLDCFATFDTGEADQQIRLLIRVDF